MYWDVELKPEDEDEIIEKIAQKIHEHDLNLVAILMIEGLKPLSFIGVNMGRVFISPFIPALGEKAGLSGEKLIQFFEKRDNFDKLLKAVENLAQEEEKRKKIEKDKKLDGKEPHNKKWWRRLIP